MSRERDVQPTILIVDDDASLLEALLRQFRANRSTWQIWTAKNGNDALRVLRTHVVELVVTDILMPEREGLELIRDLRRDHPRVKIIAMSGGGRHVGTAPLVVAGRMGAAVTLEKPFDFSVLTDAIEALLGP